MRRFLVAVTVETAGLGGDLGSVGRDLTGLRVVLVVVDVDKVVLVSGGAMTEGDLKRGLVVVSGAKVVVVSGGARTEGDVTSGGHSLQQVSAKLCSFFHRYRATLSLPETKTGRCLESSLTISTSRKRKISYRWGF